MVVALSGELHTQEGERVGTKGTCDEKRAPGHAGFKGVVEAEAESALALVS